MELQMELHPLSALKSMETYRSSTFLTILVATWNLESSPDISQEYEPTLLKKPKRQASSTSVKKKRGEGKQQEEEEQNELEKPKRRLRSQRK